MACVKQDLFGEMVNRRFFRGERGVSRPCEAVGVEGAGAAILGMGFVLLPVPMMLPIPMKVYLVAIAVLVAPASLATRAQWGDRHTLNQTIFSSWILAIPGFLKNILAMLMG